MFNLKTLKKLFQDNTIFIILVVFFLLKAITLFKYHYPIWDEAIYLSTGKFIYSFGQSGFYEILRPMFLPMVIGSFWKLGLNYVFWSEVLEIFIAMGTLYLTYSFANRIMGKKSALPSVIVLAATPLFFLHSSYILVDIPSAFFVMLSFHLLLEKKFYLSGIVAGLAFFTKFPQAIFTIAVGLYMLHQMLMSKKFKRIFIDVMKFASAFALVLVLFMVFNFFFYDQMEEDPATSTGGTEWHQKALRPIIFGVKNIYNDNFYNTKEDSGYYFKETIINNPLYLLSLVGLFFYFKDKKFKKNSLLFFAMLIFFLFYSMTDHKELRYGFSYMPFLAIFAGYGFVKAQQYIKKNKWFKIGYVVAIFVISLLLITNIAVTYSYRSDEAPAIVSEYYEFFKNQPIDGPIITTDPVVGVFTDNKVYPAYYSMPFLKKRFETVDYSAVFFNPEVFPCREDDEECNDELRFIISNMLKNNLVYEGQFHNQDKYIFTTKDYYVNLPKDDVYLKYGLSKTVKLSRFPNDKFPIIVILEDFPSLNDDFSDIWLKKNYHEMLDFFNDKELSVSAAVIPTHLEALSDSEKKSLKNTGFAFIQNGYSHKDELTKSLKEQTDLILKGKEIIKRELGVDVEAFIAPFYSTNKYTADILEGLGFKQYISNKGDSTKLSINRYDHKLTLLKNWNKKEFFTIEELSRMIPPITEYESYLLVSMYYYMFNDSMDEYLEEFYELTKDHSWMNIYELDEWRAFIKQVELTIEDDKITLTGPESELSKQLTITFFSSGNYSLKTSYETFKLKNYYEGEIYVCLNNFCRFLEPDETRTMI